MQRALRVFPPERGMQYCIIGIDISAFGILSFFVEQSTSKGAATLLVPSAAHVGIERRAM
jgi:hypothetical protein